MPDQPLRVGAVLAGERVLDGWWGKGRAASWADAIEAARAVGRMCRVRLDFRADKHAPWQSGALRGYRTPRSDGLPTARASGWPGMPANCIRE